MTKTIPIILSGGIGARLWPASRALYPKPFMELAGKPLIGHVLDRATLISDEALIITNQEHYFLTNHFINNNNYQTKLSYILEPEGRNTAPAIAIGVRHILETHGDDTKCLVLAADHLITGDDAFKETVQQAEKYSDQLVVFGIRPTSPETGYGYIQVPSQSNKPQALQKFTEKPEKSEAESYLADGCHYWNSGMFFFTASTMAEAIWEHAPDVWDASYNAFVESDFSEGVRRFAKKSFCAQPDISIDYAVMEKAQNIFMVPARFGWSDVGCWDSVAKTANKDENGNSYSGNDEVCFVDTSNSYVHTTSHIDKLTATIGVEDLLVIDMPDTLLVAHREKSQEVKTLVEKLKASRLSDFTKLPSTVRRPWGTYEILKKENYYQVKRITLDPEQMLSLQYHHHRSEHWLVIKGNALVQIGDKNYETGPGQYRHIPQGEKHRLSNIGSEELVLIEVQIGNYFGEDDIVRLEDIYGRK